VKETDMDDANPALPLANVITLGTSDFERMRRFYADLGWPMVHDEDGGSFTVFHLRGAVLALFPVDDLARDGRVTPGKGDGTIRMTVAALVGSAEEVDRLVDAMARAGGRVTKPPTDAEFFTGRSAYVADPEGNYWEIAWAPPDNPVVRAATAAAAQA
jgi:catechol 2,3-dioxygenase-like lactoylglutathione lyase family enzyme